MPAHQRKAIYHEKSRLPEICEMPLWAKKGSFMNQKKNQRYQDTDKKIRSAFLSLLEKKEIQKISIQELCDLAGIHRASFYLHYQDIYDLLEKTEAQFSRDLIDLVSAKLDECGVGNPLFTCIFSFFQDNQQFYRAYLAGHALPTFFEQARRVPICRRKSRKSVPSRRNPFSTEGTTTWYFS